MAKKLKNTSSIETNDFTKGMIKDVNASLEPKQNWTHARNAANNSVDGDVGVLGNEPANLECGSIPYTVIGAIHKQGDEWFIFSTNDISSEIGLFDDSRCGYTTIVNDGCLSFNRNYLITGASKENFDCTWQIYWDDNLNPSRTLNVDDIPWIQVQMTGPDVNGEPCITYQSTNSLDCEKIRLAPLLDVPCIKLGKAESGGQLRNGSYQAFIAYTLKSQKVTDYIGISNIQSLFDHSETAGSLKLELTNLDKDFEDFELVILSNVQQQIVAKRIGIYSTQQSTITLDFIDPALSSTPLTLLFKRSPAYEKSEAMYVVNDWLIRQGPTEQFDFNYQPLANQIKTFWTVAEYPSNYYYKGGNKTSFMRDEQYAFFIRWIYNTGERSSSYHIPGRPPRTTTSFPTPGTNQFGELVDETIIALASNNVLSPGNEMNFQVYNTATVGNTPAPTVLDDGGIIKAKGDMAYWQSTEKYPANKPEIWNVTHDSAFSGSVDPNYDLCGKNIRHHKMPTEEIDDILKLSTPNGQNIRILGVEFTNIKKPKYNNGTYIENIVGYEILRSSREGAKSILAKGIFRNMRKYTIPNKKYGSLQTNPDNLQGLYPNYPYNDLGEDVYFHDGSKVEISGTGGCPCGHIWDSIICYPPLKGVAHDVFTFHSPELMFKRPFLNAYETRIYGTMFGKSEGYFIPSEKHPKNKLLRNGSIILASIIGVGYALQKIKGKRNVKNLPLVMNFQGLDGQGRAFSTNHTGPAGSVSASGGSGGSASATSSSGSGGGGGGGSSNVTFNVNINTTPVLQSVGPGQAGYDLDDDPKAHMPGDNAVSKSVMQTTHQLYTSALGNVGIGGIINWLVNELLFFADIGTGGLAQDTSFAESNVANIELGSKLPGTFGGGQEVEIEGNGFRAMPDTLKLLAGLMGFMTHFVIGADEIIELIYNFLKPMDHVYKHNSDGSYDEFRRTTKSSDIWRSKNIDSNYLGSTFQTFGQSSFNGQPSQLYKINNLFRPDTVAINTNEKLTETSVKDHSRYVLGNTEVDNYVGNNNVYSEYSLLHPGTKVTRPISALYGALKFDFENQYGQLEGIKQVQMRGCVEYVDPSNPDTTLYSTKPIFSGDVYINRYTEKTIMPIFADFMYGQPDETVYDYLKRINIPYPRYWMNTQKYQMNKLIDFILGGFAVDNVGNALPADLFYLDRHGSSCGINIVAPGSGAQGDPNSLFAMIYGYMYSHVNGVQNFFVESEVNTAQRDWEDRKHQRHYDTYLYNDIDELFDAEIIKKDNFYKYDYSLSASRFITNLTSYGNIQPRDYDPLIAETCFSFYPKRLIYSLQAQKEAKKDFWRVFLPNNYKDFKDKVNVIKPVNKSGALIFFPYRSPQMFQGLDQLKTDLGTKLTIGDGGLFSQPFQNLVNSDISHEYGSCESARSVINTPLGIFYMSQAQGKVFHYGRSLNNIANNGMKWWFNKYLPSILIRQIPELEFTELADNPVVGVGCQSVYDSNDDIVYFMKKDYSIKEEFIDGVTFDPATYTFGYTQPKNPGGPPPMSLIITLGDPFYFNDASWTVSYDPKAKAWISFHDWHPELVLPSINHFLTTKTIIDDSTEIYCPTGYVYDPLTHLCVKSIPEVEPATVTTLELEPTVTPHLVDIRTIPIDIVILYDNRPPINSNGNVTANIPYTMSSISYSDADNAALAFITEFYNHPYITHCRNVGYGEGGYPQNKLIGIQVGVTGVNIPNYELPVNGGYSYPVHPSGHTFRNYSNCGMGSPTYFDNFITPGIPFGRGNMVSDNEQGTQPFTYGSMWSIDTEYAWFACPAADFSIRENLLQAKKNLEDYSTPMVGHALDDPNRLLNPNYKRFIIVVSNSISSVNGINIGSTPGSTTDTYRKQEVWHNLNYSNFSNSHMYPSGPPEPSAYQSSLLGGTAPENEFIMYVYTQDAGPAALIPLGFGEQYYPTANDPNNVLPRFYDNANYLTQCSTTDGTIMYNGNPIQLAFKFETQITTTPNSFPAGMIPQTNAIQAANDVVTSIKEILTAVGTTYTCSCLDDFTLVYPDLSASGHPWVLPASTPGVICEPPPGDGPICRQITCACPTGNVTSSVEVGNCPDIYAVGDPDYVNPDPLYCYYTSIITTEVQILENIEKGSIWRHNHRCDLYANYYGVDYPWEVEFVENTGQMVNTVRSLEYQLEAYIYKGDLYNGCGDDRWQDLDFNFDEAIIYNTEQVSGLLRLELNPKENPIAMLEYPIIGAADIKILYSKVEQKYRFNQFWDITNDRGEFTNVQQQIFITQLNGYIKDLNVFNLNYQKASDQRKKFRHYYNKFLLRRRISGDRKMLLKLNNTKLNLSFR